MGVCWWSGIGEILMVRFVFVNVIEIVRKVARSVGWGRTRVVIIEGVATMGSVVLSKKLTQIQILNAFEGKKGLTFAGLQDRGSHEVFRVGVFRLKL